MDVILKKSKITSSIMAQTMSATEPEIKKFKAIGFCIWKKSKWIILYNEGTSEIRKLLMITDVIAEKARTDQQHYVKVSFGVNWNPRFYACESEEESNELVEVFKEKKQYAIANGQFFL